MRSLICWILLICCHTGSAQSRHSAPAEDVIAARIRYVFGLKHAVDSNVWKSFASPRYEVPLIYFTDSVSYVANPTPKFLRLIPSTLIYADSGLRIFRNARRVDDRPFHMTTGYESGDEDSAALFNYNEPFMTCSGYEETDRRIADVTSVEQWATMVMHEYFHGFQYRHPGLFAHAQQFLYFGSDSLRRMYRNNGWFKTAVDRENGLLLNALEAPGTAGARHLIDSFFILRKARRVMAAKQLGVDITAAETYYELMEGTARYSEWGLNKYFATAGPDAQMKAIDTGFHDYKYFRGWTLEQEPWMFRTEKTSYFYATGFNMARLLDKLGIEYRSFIFDHGFSLEALLRDER